LDSNILHAQDVVTTPSAYPTVNGNPTPLEAGEAEGGKEEG